MIKMLYLNFKNERTFFLLLDALPVALQWSALEPISFSFSFNCKIREHLPAIRDPGRGHGSRVKDLDVHSSGRSQRVDIIVDNLHLPEPSRGHCLLLQDYLERWEDPVQNRLDIQIHSLWGHLGNLNHRLSKPKLN